VRKKEHDTQSFSTKSKVIEEAEGAWNSMGKQFNPFKGSEKGCVMTMAVKKERWTVLVLS